MTDPLHDQLVAVHVSAEKGCHQATIRDTAREAGITDGIIYAAARLTRARSAMVLDLIASGLEGGAR